MLLPTELLELLSRRAVGKLYTTTSSTCQSVITLSFIINSKKIKIAAIMRLMDLYHPSPQWGTCTSPLCTSPRGSPSKRSDRHRARRDRDDSDQPGEGGSMCQNIPSMVEYFA